MNFKINFYIVVVYMALAFSSCHNECYDSPKINPDYAHELSIKLSVQTKNLEKDLTYIYHRFDLAQIGIKTGRREDNDTLYINKAFILKQSSNKIRKTFGTVMQNQNFNEHKLEDEIDEYIKAIEGILDGVISDSDFGRMDKKYIEDKFINLELSKLKEIDSDEFLIERELILFKLVEIELICAELLLHKLW